VRRQLPLALAVGLPLLLYLSVAAWHAAAGTPLLRGDCPYYYATARSLIEDGDLDLAGQISRSPVHSGQISLDVEGHPVPKHPPLLPLFALPWIALFGQSGALIFNLLQLALLLALLYVLAARVTTRTSAAMAVGLLGTASFLPAYAWNFSPDVLTALLLVAATVALPPSVTDGGRRTLLRHAAAGLLFGLACTGKLSFLALAPALVLLSGWRWRPLVAFAAGLVLPLAAYGLFNLHLFGSPLVTSYDRIAHFDEQSVRLHSHRDDFNQPLLEGLAHQWGDPRRGLLWTAPIAVVGLAALPLLMRRRPRWALAVTWIAVVLPLLYARYDWWWTSEYGNRFLLPLLAFAALPLAALIEASRAPRSAPGLPPAQLPT